MALGLSCGDFWDGDCQLARYYREAAALRRERDSQQAWLQGLYIYHALLDAAPVYNPLSKRRKAYPYLEAPIPLTEAGGRRAEASENQKKLAAGREAMRLLAGALNAKRGKEG